MDRFSELVERSSLYVALLAAWIALCGSLYFSEVAGYIPCTFCWYQRILMYPLAIILPVGLLRHDRHLPLYVLPFSVVGIGVSTYHYLLQKTTLFSELASCQMGVPCSGIWINWLGFITIPFLALIAFFVITMMALIAWQAGEPAVAEASDESDTESHPRRHHWLPVGAIIAVVVIVFILLGQMTATAADEQRTAEFPVLETGAQTLLDGTAIDGGTLAEGQRLYTKACAACHGAQGEGGLGSALTTSLAVQQLPENELLQQIRTGIAADVAENHSGIAMPASGGRPELTDEEILAIIRYLRSGTRVP
jgi:disulfide bond formation protein DsbB